LTSFKRAISVSWRQVTGVQLLLLVLVEVQSELRRKYGAEGQKKAS
jgi:hypothetical protein